MATSSVKIVRPTSHQDCQGKGEGGRPKGYKSRRWHCQTRQVGSMVSFAVDGVPSTHMYEAGNWTERGDTERNWNERYGIIRQPQR